MNAIYRWLANVFPLTLVKLCAIRALQELAANPQMSAGQREIKQAEGMVRSWAGNAAIDF